MDYSDIIDLPHHVSKRHKPMPMLNRAAQFAPFAALTGYEDAIEESARTTDEAIEISSDRATQLDRAIEHLRHELASRQVPVEVEITHFVADKVKEGGRYDRNSAAVKRIDETEQRLILSDGRSIHIRDVINISLPAFGTQEVLR